MVTGGVRSAAVAGGGLALTAAIAITPSVRFSYHAPIGRAVLETTVTLVGALSALLCVGRFRRSRRQSDLVTAWAMGTLALSYPLLAALPMAVAHSGGARFGVWALVCARAAAGGLLLIAAMLSWTEPRAALPPWRRAINLSPVAIAVVAIPLLAWQTPRAAGAIAYGHRAQPLADPLVAGIQLGAAVLFTLAAFGFAQRSRLDDDRFIQWLSVGCALASVANVNYALSPSLELAWLHTGDVFRAGAIVAVTIGAVEEIVSYWEGMARLARSEERRALARDLHDGLAQELAYLVSQLQAPEAFRAPMAWRRQTQSAAERALADSRRSIQALATDSGEPFEVDLCRTASEVIARAPQSVELLTDVDLSNMQFAADDRESVLRIVRGGFDQRGMPWARDECRYQVDRARSADSPHLRQRDGIRHGKGGPERRWLRAH